MNGPKAVLIIGEAFVKNVSPSQHAHFEEILILSSSEGLVPYSSYTVTPCGHAMTPREYKRLHHKNSITQLQRLHSEREVFCLLTSSETALLGLLLGAKKQKCLNAFAASYFKSSICTSSEFLSSLHRITRYLRREKRSEPIYFRSGIADLYGLGFAAAGCAIGTTLARTNRSLNTKLLSSVLNTAKHLPVFIDNGLITMVNQGKSINSNWVMDEYRAITPQRRCHSKNLTFVIPDAPYCAAEAADIIQRHRVDILWLAERTNIVLPIHRTNNIEQHALTMLEILGYPSNITLGVPCLKNKGLDFELSCSDIEKLLMLKNPRTRKPAFTKVHMLGISDSTSSSKLNPRLLLMRLYGIDCSCDASRFTAIFGRYSSGNLRKGSIVVNRLEDEYKRKQIVSSKPYTEFTYERDSFGYDQFSLMDDFYELVTEDDIVTFWTLFNALVSDEAPALSMSVNESDCKLELVELAWQVLGYATVPRLLFEQYKRINWHLFEPMVRKAITISEMSYFDKRFDALKTIFAKNTTNPVQLPLL
ncbi:hypothetical protein J4N45_10190 [Vibrio sp. SCSIO 43140]|uniref:hypothetical protein n=1 Tax=Vibrio sp. SCSIO 43140 TaxID=2819100 RepID=UPI002075B036|nr:hypothetical protein [Vibrio sp. SCSIO 43140]USD58898.1 hypothetical protein J4N45_10190 [Vibrio sp. SCSIO 43140]